MFYVSGLDKDNRLWKVTDTNDGVEESYSFKELKEFRSQGIEILGMSDNCCHQCVIIDKFVIVPDIANNSVVVKYLATGDTSEIFNFSTVHNTRNKVWFTGSLRVNKVKDGIAVSCGVCVKYDYEFTGTFIFKVNSNGVVIDRLDDILFVCDDANKAHNTIECTGGDCPNFITSITANKILKKKGMI